MIAYDLECEKGHSFEGWFENAKSFDEQLKKGLVECPVCGSVKVTRMLSTFGIAKSRRSEVHAEKPEIDGPAALQMLTQYVKDNFEDVGADFTKEALKMHYGVSEHRNIRGVSSDKEEETLKQEGVPFFKFPVPSDSEPSEE